MTIRMTVVKLFFSGTHDHSTVTTPSRTEEQNSIVRRNESRLLLENGCDPNTVEDLAMSRGRWVAARSPMNRSLMCCAARLGNSDVVRVLLQTGVDPNKECASDCSTPIVAAAYNGKESTVRVLLNSWACPSRCDKFGHSALYYAETFGHCAAFQMMQAHVPLAAARDRVGALQRLAFAACFSGAHFALPGGVAAAVALLALPWIACQEAQRAEKKKRKKKKKKKKGKKKKKTTTKKTTSIAEPAVASPVVSAPAVVDCSVCLASLDQSMARNNTVLTDAYPA